MKKGLLNIVFVLFTVTIYAQADSSKLDIQKEVIIVKSAELPVMKATKLTNNPSIEDSVIPPPEIKYSVLKKQIPTEFEIDPIKPARMKGEPLSPLSKAYVKGGLGNYTNVMFEGYVNNTRSRKHSVGAYAKHFSSQGGIKDVGYNGFSKNQAVFYGKKFLKKHLIQGELMYDRNTFHYYGFNTDDYKEQGNLAKDSTKQWFSKSSADVRLMSFIKDSTKLNYESKLSYYNLIDRQGRMENNGVLTVNFRKYYIPKDSGVVTNQVIRLNTSFDYNNFYNGVEPFGNGIFKLYPHFTAQGKKFNVDFGGSVFVEAFDNKAGFHFYPNAHVKYNVLRDLLIPYVGVEGGIKRTNYNSLTNQNQFLVTYSPMLNLKTLFNVYGGVRGAFSSKMAFNVMASRKRLVNMPLFVNRYSLGASVDLNGEISYYRWGVGNTFNVIYDTVDVTTIDAQLSYISTERINVIARGEYYLYSLQTQAEAWNMPNWKATVSGTYNLKNKIIAKIDVFAVSERKALIYDSTSTYIGIDEIGVDMYSKTLPVFVGLNIGLEYRYNQKISAFINFNNILGKNYYSWNNYPTQGFNVLGGFTFSFWD